MLSACASTHPSFGKGKSVALHVSETVELRCARPIIDAARKTVSIAWVAARAPEDRPRIEHMELTVFDDRNGDRRPDPGEILESRTSAAPSHYIVFGPLTATGRDSIESLRGLLRVRTSHRAREVNWQLMRREDID